MAGHHSPCPAAGRRNWRAGLALALGAVVGTVLVAGILAAAGPGGGALRPAGSSAAERTPHGLTVHSTLADSPSSTHSGSGQVFAPSGSYPGAIGAAGTHSGVGYWLFAADGGIFTFGDAAFHGSTGAMRLNQPIVGMTPTSDGGGYWLVARDGGIFTFGDAAFHGSTGGMRLNQPIVGMASTPDGGGYWLVAADGGIFSFGDAAFHGSTGAIRLNQPIVAMASTPSGHGYWMLAADGGLFNFGDAAFSGAAAGRPAAAAVAIVPTSSGHGYWIVAGDGEAFQYGDAAAVGSGAGAVSAPVVGAAVQPGGLRVISADGSNLSLTPGSAGAAVASARPSAGNPGSFTYLVTNDDGSPVRYNSCQAIHYVTNMDGAPAGASGLVAGALARITAATGITFVNDGSTTEVPSAERSAYQPARYGQRWAPVLIAWSNPAVSDLLPGGDTIGEGGSSWVQAGSGPKVYVTGEAVLDSANTAGLPATFGSGATVGELLLHELGHVVGMGHTQDPNQVMYPVLLPLSSASYGAGDLGGLAHLGTQGGCLSTPAP
ncbi:MAG TPA: matrixin family metalloprotease [Acidimicrobiales bacterium]